VVFTRFDEEGALTPTDSANVGSVEPTVLPGNGTAALQGKDGEDVARESPGEILERLRAASERRHQEVTRLSTDVAQLGDEIAKIRDEREAVLDELAKLRVEVAEAAERAGALRTPTDVQRPVEEPTAHAWPAEEPDGSQGSDSGAIGRFRLRRRR
jgi:septal ring factor EnvC (AmiA/AmiB activator)